MHPDSCFLTNMDDGHPRGHLQVTSTGCTGIQRSVLYHTRVQYIIPMLVETASRPCQEHRRVPSLSPSLPLSPSPSSRGLSQPGEPRARPKTVEYKPLRFGAWGGFVESNYRGCGTALGETRWTELDTSSSLSFDHFSTSFCGLHRLRCRILLWLLAGYTRQKGKKNNENRFPHKCVQSGSC